MDRDGATAAYTKACCAAVYGSELVHLLLGGRLHPGGDELTRRLADLTGIGPGDRVLDVASGLGTSARLLSAERGAVVRGVELSPRLVMQAERDTAEAGLDHLSSFEVGDAERLPGGGSLLRRRPVRVRAVHVPRSGGGRRGLPARARSGRQGWDRGRHHGSRHACRPSSTHRSAASPASPAPCPSGYERLLREGGYTDVVVEPHPEAAVAAVDSMRNGLEAARGALRGFFDVGSALRLVELARDAVSEGVIGYALIAATVGEAELHVGAAAGGHRADGPLD